MCEIQKSHSPNKTFFIRPVLNSPFDTGLLSFIRLCQFRIRRMIIHGEWCTVACSRSRIGAMNTRMQGCKDGALLTRPWRVQYFPLVLLRLPMAHRRYAGFVFRLRVSGKGHPCPVTPVQHIPVLHTLRFSCIFVCHSRQTPQVTSPEKQTRRAAMYTLAA